MSRDVNGNYTLPAGNPVSSGTVITIAWGNSTLSDVGTEITNSLDRSGRGGMLAALKGIDGTVAAPAFSFTSEPTSGWYRVGAGVIGLSVTNRLGISQAAAGNVTIATPSSGSTLTLNGAAATNATTLTMGGTTTGSNAIVGSNTGATYIVGLESSVGGALLTGTPAYATVLTAYTSTALSLGTNAIERMRITGAGNVTINAPSSGTTLTVNGIGPTIAVGGAGTSSQQITLANTGGTATLAVDGSGGGSIISGSSAYATILTSLGATSTIIGTNSIARIATNSAGNVTINTPSSGTALTVTGTIDAITTANSYSRSLFSNTNAGSSAIGGLRISNGTNSADVAITGTGYSGSVLTGSPSGLTTVINATGASNSLTLGTNDVARLVFNASGAWGAGGTNYGTSGQVLTSGGSGAAPSWSNTGIDIVRFKNVITSRTSTVTTTADPDLSASLVAGAYSFEICAWVDSVGGTPGIRTALGFSGGVTGTVVAITETLIVSTFAESVTSSPFSDINWGTTSGSSYGNFVVYRGWIQVSSTGNLTFNWAQSSSSASATNVRPGSYMKVTKLD